MLILNGFDNWGVSSYNGQYIDNNIYKGKKYLFYSCTNMDDTDLFDGHEEMMDTLYVMDIREVDNSGSDRMFYSFCDYQKFENVRCIRITWSDGTIEEAETDFDNVLAGMKSDDRRFYFFHMETKETYEQVGSIGYTVMDNTPYGKLVHLGYFTYPEFWSNGYVTEALKRILEFAFKENGVYRVSTGCLKENKGSERVMQKCGMIKEADKKEYEYHDGKMKDRVEYRLLKSEWEGVL